MIITRFVSKVLIFLSPIFLIAALFIYLDVFRVFGEYENYYDSNLVSINREMVTTRTYQKRCKEVKFNSFIFGNSRSQAFKCLNWSSYLDSTDNPFHFDAGGEGVYGVSNKVSYIDQTGGKIDHALVVVDSEFLLNTANRSGHLSISPVELSKNSKLPYYMEFVRASLNLKFIVAYIDYKIFSVHRNYMRTLFVNAKYPNKVNNINCDMWYGYDQHILMDSLGYYKKLTDNGTFYKRPRKKLATKCIVTELEVKQLRDIKSIFDKHNTKYKIVISPLYNQIALEVTQVALLESVFGPRNIYNYSGKNVFTETIYNYYENSHYRPHVANKILKIMYK